MSKLKEMIQQFCPNGVKYKNLGDIGLFFGGLTGKSKDDFKDGNAKFITYRNVYANPSLNIDIEDKVKISDNEKQHVIRYGDILFTGSSETPDECGMSSIVTNQICDELYLNSFCFGLRLYKIEEFDLHYLKHVLRSSDIRKQIKKTASGVTRYNVSKKLFAKVCIPVPPIEIQTEIAHILDDFTNLAAELQAELQARKEQYEHYRNKLLTFDKIEKDTKSVNWIKMSEICDIRRGIRVTRNCLVNNGLFYVFQNSLTPLGKFDKYNRDGNKTFVICAGAAGDIGYSNKPFWAADDCFTIETDKVDNKYIYHFLLTKRLFLKSRVRKASVPRLSASEIGKLVIPVPSIAEQERIVSILDQFETLVNDLSQGLPAEIAAVQEQYEYYRNKLLSFQKITEA